MLNIVGPVNQTSYGYTTTNIVKALSDLTDVALFPISSPQQIDKSFIPSIQQSLDNARFYNHKAPCIRIWHQFALDLFVGKGPRIGFPIFELEQFTAQEIHQLSSVDHLFACSQWGVDVYLKNRTAEKKSCSVIPLGVDPSIFFPNKKPSSSGPYIFLNMGKWEVRKGHDILVEAFNSAFSSSDNVELWMCNHNPFYSEEENKKWENLYKNSKLGHKVRIISRLSSHNEVARLMNKVHCGVFPSRAEGWNLEALEMMACGRDLVITDCTAHTEYIHDGDCYIVPTAGVEKAFDGKWFHGQGDWHKPDVEALAVQMRAAYENRKDDFNDKNAKVGEKFTWHNSAAKILRACEGMYS